MDLIYYGIIYFYKMIIQIYKSYLIFTISPINNFYIFIINNKVFYKFIKKRYLDENKDNKLYLTNCQYCKTINIVL